MDGPFNVVRYLVLLIQPGVAASLLRELPALLQLKKRKPWVTKTLRMSKVSSRPYMGVRPTLPTYFRCSPVLRLLSFAIFLLYFIITVSTEGSTSHFSHVGGFLAGLFPAFLYLPNFKHDWWEVGFATADIVSG
jgi:hypothetical protein